MDQTAKKPSNFIHEIIEADLAAGRCSEVITRFPPEPNGCLHIGHAKAIHLDFSTAEKYRGRCHLRLDDTNPETSSENFVQAIQEDIKWLGYNWGEKKFRASNYFDVMYEYALRLIRKGKAYVCNLTQEEFKVYRGTPDQPGEAPPGRDRCIAENLELFEKMKNAEFEEGACVLRAKIDMASPNLHMRDPAIYRLKKTPHYYTGNRWNIYPAYDFAHCIEDSIERISHSMCTLEFEVHRPLYDWILREVNIFRPRQIEFARLNLTRTVMSKRKLSVLVNEKLVSGWDDPRMPTLCGMRRRGYTPAAICEFCALVGCTKFESMSEIELLENCVRNDLNETAPRFMAIMDPLKIIIENYPEELEEQFELPRHPKKEQAGRRPVLFNRELYIERDDYMDEAPAAFRRFAIGREVRLRGAYLATCTGVQKDIEGNVLSISCSYDPQSKGGNAPDGRKVKGTIHWVSAKHAVDAEIRLYDHLFTVKNPVEDKEKEFKKWLNPASLQVITAKIEPGLINAAPGDRFQFERVGYFCADSDHTRKYPVFNRTITLRASPKRM